MRATAADMVLLHAAGSGGDKSLDNYLGFNYHTLPMAVHQVSGAEDE